MRITQINSIRKPAVAFALICLAVLVPLASVAKQEGFLIVPGEGVGDIRLGAGVKNVFEAMGKMKADKKEAVKRICGDKEQTETWLSYESRGLQMGYDVKKVLIRIVVTSSGLRVKGSGLHVGEKIQRITDSYNEPEKLIQKDTADAARVIMSYPSLGIGFLVDNKMGTIVAIIITPRDNGGCH